MSLDQLRYFVAVAEAGTTHGAAARLHVSQPPLSRQIRALEHELGVSLFERTARGMALRPEGHALLSRARSILSLVEETVLEMHSAGDLGKGSGHGTDSSGRLD